MWTADDVFLLFLVFMIKNLRKANSSCRRLVDFRWV